MDNKEYRKKKIISISIIVFIIILLISAGTFAYWTWVTATGERTNVTLTIEAPDMEARLTGYTQNITNLIPISSCTDETYAIKKQLTLTYNNNSTNAAEILGTLKITGFSTEHGTPNTTALSHLHYAVTTSPDSCTAEPLEGMSGVFTTRNGNLFTSQKLAGPIPSGTEETSMTFYLWVWLDSEYNHQNVGSEVSSDPMQDISFTLVWEGEIKNDLTISQEPNAPVLDAGMIPVKIANNGVVKTVAEDDSTWYNYENKEWANVVLVDSDSRTTYKGSAGVTVSEDDILAYYVWIPRYKYKIWTTDATTTTNPQTIDIEFESKEAVPVLGTDVDEWRTHPAFIWDENTISGIWVGKFETGHLKSEILSANNLSCTDENCTGADGLRIKPNVRSSRYNNISNQFYASRSMTRSGNTFGFSSSTTDTHMMKNSEWGAVAYLSHSEYGINSEIRINNNNDFKTGCGALEENGSSTSECQIAYGEATNYPQSTTGNISGVFDMSGGAFEYVMGNYNNMIEDTGFTTLPAAKYYDVYLISSISSCTIEICGGHALFETSGWYSDDDDYFVRTDGPWFWRGGYNGYDSKAGVWAMSIDVGGPHTNIGFRSSAIVGA